jgi:hypothetical protein
MDGKLIPQNYEEWRHCITVSCGLSLTPAYIADRIAALNDTNDYSTQRFVQLYGQQHLTQVIRWFEQARHAD